MLEPLSEWLPDCGADVLCVQETKAQEHQLHVPELLPDGYRAFFKDAITKKGYSGVGIYTRKPPDEVRTSLGWAPDTELASPEQRPRQAGG